MVKITIQNLGQIEGALEKKLDKALEMTCENIIANVESRLINENHVASGYLLNSFHYNRLAFNEYEIFSTAPYAIFIENGTLPHDIFPKNAKALHWSDGGGQHFSKHVKHPGFPASPFFEPSYLEGIKELPTLLKRLK